MIHDSAENEIGPNSANGTKQTNTLYTHNTTRTRTHSHNNKFNVHVNNKFLENKDITVTFLTPFEVNFVKS